MTRLRATDERGIPWPGALGYPRRLAALAALRAVALATARVAVYPSVFWPFMPGRSSWWPEGRPSHRASC